MRTAAAALSLAVGLIRPEPACADALTRATLAFVFEGVPITLTDTSVGGTVVGNRFTLEPGSGFATTLCIGSASGCQAPPTPFPPPVTRLDIQMGPNGGISGTLSDATIEPCGAGIGCNAGVTAKIGKAPAFTLLHLAYSFGASGTAHWSDPLGTLSVVVQNSPWHLGPVTATGLTSLGAPLPDVMATGGLQWDPIERVVTLVSLSRVRVRGLADLTTATPVFLRLFYTHDHELPLSTWRCPEPGQAMLLGGAALGLLTAGFRRRADVRKPAS